MSLTLVLNRGSHFLRFPLSPSYSIRSSSNLSIHNFTISRPTTHNTLRILTSTHSTTTPSQLTFFTRSLSSTKPQPQSVPAGHILKPFILADIGEGITGCEIVKWLVKPNQVVAEFDPVVEVQSDKATVEITSPFEGTIHRLFGVAGEVIKVGQPLCEMVVKPEDDSELVAPTATESINQEPSMPEIESEVKVSTESSESVVGFVHSTPAVRRLAKEHAIDIRLITGTGKDQRVTKEDVLLHLSRPSTSSTHTSAPAPVSSLNPPAIAPVSPISSGTVRVPFNAVRQAMFRSMSNALKIPHFGYSEQIDVTELERVRLELNSTSEDGRRLTLFSLLIKAMGYALRSEPIFRSTLAEPFCFVQRQTVDISIALSSPQGLLTPLVPNVGQKTVFEIADHVRRLREFVESLPDSDRLPVFPEELGGNRPGTFTLSNIGVIGAYTFPVIPPTGQLAIGAFGKVQVVPGYRPTDMSEARAVAQGLSRGQPPIPEPRLMLCASFSADHRAVEGVELARLVQRLKEICERPSHFIRLGI